MELLLLVPLVVSALVLSTPLVLYLGDRLTWTSGALAGVGVLVLLYSLALSAVRADQQPGGFSDRPLGEAPAELLVSGALALGALAVGVRVRWVAVSGPRSYPSPMEPSAVRALPVTLHESMLLQAGLDSYLTAFAVHRAADVGASHPEEEWRELQRDIKDLQERLRALHRE